MIKSFFKLIGFLVIITTAMMLVKAIAPKPSHKEMDLLLANLDQIEQSDTSIFFIGSSRVKKSINPSILQQEIPGKNIFNLGISGGTFLSNHIMANYAMQLKGHKILFIELSSTRLIFTKDLVNFCKTKDIEFMNAAFQATRFLSFSDRIEVGLQTVNWYLFQFLSFRNEFKWLIQPAQVKEVEPWIGYTRLVGSKGNFSPLFLEKKDIKTTSITNSTIENQYKIIESLQEKAQKYDVKIVYFLPTTFAKETEKSNMLALYSKLKSAQRLDFTTHFFSQVIKKEHLYDYNHFNITGAAIYTMEMVPSIKSHF